MVDLKSQYQKIQSEIDTGMAAVIESTAFINGPEVQTFSSNLAQYLACEHVIPCGNGTDALQIALMVLGLNPGDEVITANFTFAATVEVIALLGLTPVLVDVDPETFVLTPQAVEQAITSKTKAIIPVHLFGQCAPMEAIMNIAATHHLYVVEDTAQAIGAACKVNGEWKKAGTIGHFGTTSFFPSKNLGCYGDGGALFTRDASLAQKAKAITNHGMTKKYYHDTIGVNSRLDSIQAVVLNAKLPHLDTYCAARQEAAAFYTSALAEIPELITPKKNEYSTHVFHQYTLRVTHGKRNALKEYLADNQIPSMIYYPVPLHAQKAYRQEKGGIDSDFPATMELVDQVLSLPMHTELKTEQLNYIVEKIKAFFE